ncbi:hypothetical protein D3C81_1091620 [compost metagenome]
MAIGPGTAISRILRKIPIAAVTLKAIMATVRASSSRPEPIFWAMTIPAPLATVANSVVSALNSWLENPTTATALSDMRLTINVSTVPSRICRNNSINIGQASSQRENLSFSPPLIFFIITTSWISENPMDSLSSC